LKNDVVIENQRIIECGITDPLQIYSGWLDEHEHDHGMQFWPPNVLTDITQFLLAHGDVALTNDMLKDQKVDKVCDGEHFVLKIHKLLLLFDLAVKKYPSCSHPLEKYSLALPTL
jgi:hypothetical protein